MFLSFLNIVLPVFLLDSFVLLRTLVVFYQWLLFVRHCCLRFLFLGRVCCYSSLSKKNCFCFKRAVFWNKFKLEQDRFTTCFKICRRNSLVFPKRFKTLSKKESLPESFKMGQKGAKNGASI